MIVLTGKSCSGKDSIGKELEKLGIKKLVTYTSRPPRENEVDGVDYHFVSFNDFKNLVKKSFFAEWRIYKTNEGIWMYGSAKKDYKAVNNKYIILTPDGLDTIKNKGINVISFYIDATDDVILERLKKRGDNKEEATRRFIQDKKDFEGIKQKVDFVLFNDIADYIVFSDNDSTPVELAKLILGIYRLKQRKENA